MACSARSTTAHRRAARRPELPASRMHFVFVHGWGFNAGIWRDLTGYMRNHAFSLVDLGFVAGGPPSASVWPKDAIAVGHSLGLLWLLHRAEEQGRVPFRGLVSIQGFDRFCPPIPLSRVAGMRRGLRRAAYQTVEVFWSGCGSEPFASPGALNVGRLDEGLGWLMDWDETETKACASVLARPDSVIIFTMPA